MTNLTVTHDVPASEQESSFINATLQDLSDGRTISVAVHLPEDFLKGYDTPEQIEQRLWWAFAGVSALGFSIECQIGPNDEEGAPT